MLASNPGVWESMVELTMEAQEKCLDPLIWLRHISSALNSAGISRPSPELAHILVSHICWSNNIPIVWKFLDMAMNSDIVPPMLVIALLSARTIPYRKIHPAAYRLLLELIKVHTFSFASKINGPNYQKVMKSVDDVLHLTKMFGIEVCEIGTCVVGFVFSIVWQLLDASLDDERLLKFTSEENSTQSTMSHDMEIDCNYFDEHKTKFFEGAQKINTSMAIKIIESFFENKVTSRILLLVRRNLPSHWEGLIQRLQLLVTHSSSLSFTTSMTPQDLLKFTSNTHNVLRPKPKTSSKQQFHAMMAPGSLISSASISYGAYSSALWLPIDLFMEETVNCSARMSTSAAVVLTGLVKALQAVNNTTWRDTFLGLWIAVLRLVQRERDPTLNPIDGLGVALCMLLSITTLAIVNIIKEEENSSTDDKFHSPNSLEKLKEVSGNRRKELGLSLQLLGDYKGLLTGHPTFISAANQAAAKAMLFRSGFTDDTVTSDMLVDCNGNLWHLIVEACIARNLVDTSAYSWPGYVNECKNLVPNSIPSTGFGWSPFMKGSPLTAMMIDELVSTPASCLAELEKIFDIALNGSDDDKISAATILCGASLLHGWNIQEHTLGFIIRLLSPPVPANFSGGDSHLFGVAPFLNVLVVGISPSDRVIIFSLHGFIPQLAGALMPICEVFGSCVSKFSWTLATGEQISAHAIFSNAFTLLLRLWNFNHPQIEHVISHTPPVGSEITPEYLLMVRNCQLLCPGIIRDQNKSQNISFSPTAPYMEPMYMDSFPKLKLWCQQQQACIVSTLSGLAHGNPVHHIVDGLLHMMFQKLRTDQTLATRTSGNSTPDGMAEDASILLKLPAWHILEAVPFALDAAFTACAHGTLSPRELATGLKDLADFLPASVATIISYFSAEVTRGVWKPAFMNGTDWPSPAANLFTVEQQIKKILTDTGVDVPSLAAGEYVETALPLPLAAFLSLTITYKIEKTTTSVLIMAGLALSNLAACCPWPCMPVISALWARKAKGWSDFLVLKAACTVFHHNSDAVVQLLKICFSSITGPKSSCISSSGCVAALLGHGLRSNSSIGISSVAPGILFLKVHQYVKDVVLMTEEIVSLIMQSVGEIAASGLPRDQAEKLLKSRSGGSRYGRVSLAASMAQLKAAASLGASLVWISGGLSLIRTLLRETLPSRFISGRGLGSEDDSEGGLVAMLGGYALAYFSILCWTFACGLDSKSAASKSRVRILDTHLKFIAGALDGKISLGCNCAMWRAYVSGLLGLLVECTPMWIMAADVNVLRRLSRGLRHWNEEELALALLETGGLTTMGAAAELIIETGG